MNKIGEWFRKNIFRQYILTGLFWEKRGDDYVLRKDKGRKVEDKMGKKRFFFYDHGATLPVSYKFINAERLVNFYRPDDDTIFPFRINFSKFGDRINTKIETIDDDMKFFGMQEFREAQNKYLNEKSNLSKLLGNPIFAAFVILIGAGIFFAILNQGLSGNVGKFADAVTEFTKAAKQIKDVGAGGF